MAFKWNLLLKVKGINVSSLHCMKLYVTGGFFNEFLPSGLGGDLYKVKSLVSQGKSLKDVASSIVVERVLGFLSTSLSAFVAVTAVAMFYDSSLSSYILPLFLVFSSSFVLFIILVRPTVWNYIFNLFGKYNTTAIFRKFQSIYEVLTEFKNEPLVLLRFFLLSLTEQAYGSVLVYMGAIILGLKVSIIYFFALIPAILIIARLPISVQGIGIQEGLFMFFFSSIGMQTTDAFSLALLMRMGGWVLSLSGGFIYLTANISKAKTDKNYSG